MNEMQMACRRAQIEAHIERCRDVAAENLVEIGRWLCRAKDEGVVPHGEWTGWVAQHAGMNERTAQRAMQFARELPEGSSLARLGVAKISALLTLPAPEREAAAQQMDAERISSREVDARVKALRAERDEALRVVGEQKKRLAQAEQEKADALRAEQDFAARVQEETERRTQALSKRIEVAEDNADKLHRSLRKKEQQVIELMAKLDAERAKLAGADPAAQKQISALEQEIDRLSGQLDEAQLQLMRGGMAGEERVSPATRILSAVGGMMAQAGSAPGELACMGGELDGETRQLLIGQAQLVGRWAMSVIGACGGEMDG